MPARNSRIRNICDEVPFCDHRSNRRKRRREAADAENCVPVGLLRMYAIGRGGTFFWWLFAVPSSGETNSHSYSAQSGDYWRRNFVHFYEHFCLKSKGLSARTKGKGRGRLKIRQRLIKGESRAIFLHQKSRE